MASLNLYIYNYVPIMSPVRKTIGNPDDDLIEKVPRADLSSCCPKVLPCTEDPGAAGAHVPAARGQVPLLSDHV